MMRILSRSKSREGKKCGLISAAQMKDEQTARFHPFQSHADTSGGRCIYVNKGVWWVGKSLSLPHASLTETHNLPASSGLKRVGGRGGDK